MSYEYCFCTNSIITEDAIAIFTITTIALDYY